MAKFEVVRTIGRGGFGIVEEVINSRGEHLARKTFKPSADIPADCHGSLRKRFKREVKIQTELGGHEIIPVLVSDLEGDSPWFIMPLAELTYDKRNAAADRRTGKVNVDAVADILNALQYLHDLDYTHRDLNPKNILLHDGKWKLSDLGAILPPDGRTAVLTEQTIIFTEQYCSPEQRNDFHAAQPPSDIYALGCILHDIFGLPPRTPYRQHTAPDPVGAIIEKCTEVDPERRPSVKKLREILLETLVEVGGECKIDDQQSESWLKRLETIDAWTAEDFDNFARFFAQLDTDERTPQDAGRWVYSLSTPFLTRLPADALGKIVARRDGIAGKIVAKYCDWVRNTNFLFHFADTVCGRLAAILDSGGISDKAQALIAMFELADSHHRYYVMRKALNRCDSDQLSSGEARRLAIEIRTEEMESALVRCIAEVEWDKKKLAPDIRKLCGD